MTLDMHEAVSWRRTRLPADTSCAAMALWTAARHRMWCPNSLAQGALQAFFTFSGCMRSEEGFWGKSYCKRMDDSVTSLLLLVGRILSCCGNPLTADESGHDLLFLLSWLCLRLLSNLLVPSNEHQLARVVLAASQAGIQRRACWCLALSWALSHKCADLVHSALQNLQRHPSQRRQATVGDCQA